MGMCSGSLWDRDRMFVVDIYSCLCRELVAEGELSLNEVNFPGRECPIFFGLGTPFVSLLW